MVTATDTLLAPDPAVPQRDLLLDSDVAGRVLVSHALGGAPPERCERRYAKYRVGHSLRVVYAIDGGRLHVAARTFARGASAEAFRGAADRLAPRGGAPRVVHVPDLDTVLWTFPHDRKLSTLGILTTPSPALDRLTGRTVTRTRLVAYAAERSATVACADPGGRLVAYARVQGDGLAAAEARELMRIATALGSCHPDLRVPGVLGVSEPHRALATTAISGQRLDSLRGDERLRAFERLGAALAALHRLPPSADRFERLDPARLVTAARLIARARPPEGPLAAELLDALLARPARPAPLVHLHGDANLRNAILDGDRVALVDLEHAAAGPAAADLGQIAAGLLLDRIRGTITPGEEAELTSALLSGYERRAPAPGPDAVRWFTSASVLARVALPAIGRVRPDTLRHLGPLLDAAVEFLP